MTDPQHPESSRPRLRASSRSDEPQAKTFDEIIQGKSTEEYSIPSDDEGLPYFEDVSADLDARTDFIKDPTDFQDRATEVKDGKRRRAIILAGFTLIILIAGGYFFVQLLTSAQEDRQVPAPVVTAPEATESAPTTPAETAGLFAEDFPDGIAVTPAEVLIKQEGPSAFLSSSGHRLAVEGGTVTEAADACKVANLTDFCYVGAGEAATTPFDIYFFKDIVASKVFASVNDSAPATVPGAAAAHKVFVNFIPGTETVGIALAFEDGSGYFITTTDVPSVETLLPLFSSL